MQALCNDIALIADDLGFRMKSVKTDDHAAIHDLVFIPIDQKPYLDPLFGKTVGESKIQKPQETYEVTTIPEVFLTQKRRHIEASETRS